MSVSRILSAAFAAALLMAAGGAVAQQTGPDETQVVARVNGEDVLLGEVLKLAANLSPQYQQQFAQIYPLLVKRVVDFRLAGKAGLDEGLATDAEVAERVAEAQERAIREVYIERKIAARVTDEAVRQQYAKFLAHAVSEGKRSHKMSQSERMLAVE